jgi:hypothetical protein
MDRPNWSYNISIRVVVFIIGLLRRGAESYDEAYSKAYPKAQKSQTTLEAWTWQFPESF